MRVILVFRLEGVAAGEVVQGGGTSSKIQRVRNSISTRRTSVSGDMRPMSLPTRLASLDCGRRGSAPADATRSSCWQRATRRPPFVPARAAFARVVKLGTEKADDDGFFAA